jgi:hypothetical protein
MLRVVDPTQNANKTFTCTYAGELSSQSKNDWAKAVASYYFVSRTVVYGSSTKKEDAIRTGLFVNKLIRDAREKILSSTQANIICDGAMNALTYRAGNCSEQTSLAIIYLLSRECYSLSMIGMLGGDHNFLAIGLNNDSDLKKQINIPAEAIIVDPWTDDIYFATEFPNKVTHDKFCALKGTPIIKWSFERDGLPWLKTTLKEDISYKLRQFLIDHASTSEQELRNKKLISGEPHKPLKQNQAVLMAEVRAYQKPTFFKYNKNTSTNSQRTYANENGFGYLIEKMADNILAMYFLNEIPLKSITLTSVMPLSRIPNFNIDSLHKEIMNDMFFKIKFAKMYELYKKMTSRTYIDSCEYDCTQKLIELVDKLEEFIEAEITIRKNLGRA